MRSSIMSLFVTTLVACSGTQGPVGPAGATGARGDQGPKGDPGAAVTVSVLAVGNTDCPAGGVEMISTDGRRVVCNGSRGTNGTSVTVAAEMPGMNCPSGGAQLTAGGNTTFVCNGAGGSARGVTLPDGGLLASAVVVADSDGGLRLEDQLRVTRGNVKLPNGVNSVIGMDTVAFGGTNLTVSAGGTTGMGGAAGGGTLELRAGDSNVSGAPTCNTCDPNTVGSCPGPANNSLRLFAGDNAPGQAFFCSNWANGDIELYAGHGQPIRMVVNGNSGNVGIGVPFPTQKLQVAGNVLANNVSLPSDARLKQDIKTIEHAGDLLKELRGVRYRWTPAARAKLQADDAMMLGLLAQDVQKVMPEAVLALPDGTLTVSYEKVVPVLVEALKAQDARIHQLEGTEQRLKALEQRLKALERR